MLAVCGNLSSVFSETGSGFGKGINHVVARATTKSTYGEKRFVAIGR